MSNESVSLPEISSTLHSRVNLNHDWRFCKGDPSDVGNTLDYESIKAWLLPSANAFVHESVQRPAGIAPGATLACVQSDYDDTAWRSLDLPHDWGIEGPFDMDLPSPTGKLPWFGVAWYRKTFALAAEDAGRCVYLQVDGAMSYATVWCNGQFVGGWPYGYSSWHLDLTPYIKPGQANTLAIRLDNPDQSSRWYPGGGIYRQVHLIKTSATHVLPWGIFVSTPQITDAQATIHVQTAIADADLNGSQTTVVTQIFKQNVDGSLQPTALAQGQSDQWAVNAFGQTVNHMQITLPSPQRWEVADPQLYTAVTQLHVDGKPVDEYQTSFGIREIAFTVDDGFHLNGRRVPLQGVCMHHDLGALGAAFNVRACERQLQILKEMGVNAIRCAHNPPAPQMLDLCDRMGLLVVDEFADTWSIAKTPLGYARLFPDWAEADLRAMIRRDRNHPCVILWSNGNEIKEQHDPQNHYVSHWLNGITHDEDPTRPTTCGCDYPRSGYDGFQKTMDVFGYNYKPHEYAAFREHNPDQPLYGSETASAISSRGVYAFPVSDDKDQGRIGFHVSSYDLYAPPWASPPDVEFKGQDQHRHVAGEFVWTGFDYLGEPTPFNCDYTVLTNFHTEHEKAAAEAQLKELGKVKVTSRSSYFGIVDMAGFKKDRFFMYQSRWRADLPMAHILPHWTWQDRVGQVTPVHVYTSGDAAELFLNGRSLGRKTKGEYEYRLRWDDVIYEPGELKVIAYKDGMTWAEATQRSAGSGVRLVLEVDRQVLKADGDDMAFITARVVDDQGILVPHAAHQVQFSVDGPAVIEATDNGDPTDHTVFASPSRQAFGGMVLAIVRTQAGKFGVIDVTATCPGLESASVRITS